MTRYTADHEWIRLEGDTATVGISEHAQQALGDITFIELPPVGKTVKQGDTLGVVESVKAASDVFAPAGGTVATVNTVLGTAPETINAAAESDGWICTLAGVDPAELEGLMTPEQYADFCKA
jgi:glycine cleavage system H protein